MTTDSPKGKEQHNPAPSAPAPAKRDYSRAAIMAWMWVGIIVLCGVAIYLLRVLTTPVGVVIWTAIIVFCLHGIVNGLERRGLNRVAGTAISYVIMIAVIAVIAILMFSPLFGFGDQFKSLVESIPSYVQGLVDWGRSLSKDYAWLLSNDTANEWLASVGNALADFVNNLASGLAQGVVDLGGVIVGSGVCIGFSLVLSFWILIELPGIGRELMRVISPQRREDAQVLKFTMTRIMGGFIKGTFIQCLVLGVACGILFALCGIPNAAALGVISGVFNLLPMIGAWIGGILAGIVGFMVSPITAIVAVVGTVIIQQIVYNFIGPKIMQNNVDVHPALTVFVLLLASAIGGAMGGIMGSLIGMLLGIPAVAVMKALFVYYFQKGTGRTIVALDGVFFKGDPEAFNRQMNPALAEGASGETGESNGEIGENQGNSGAEQAPDMAQPQSNGVSNDK